MKKPPFIKLTFAPLQFYMLPPLFFILSICLAPSTTALGNETDHSALLAIKSRLVAHDAGVFRSWNHSLHHCSWNGVTCERKYNRVIQLNLSSRGLVGTISPFIGNLSFLKNLTLYNNSLVGHIPPEIGRLFRLQSLLLFNNTISGEIPSNLSACYNLQRLSIGFNKLEGKLPPELRALSKLKFLGLHFNNLVGPLFEIIANITSLEGISAAGNYFMGHIPTNIGKMRNLNLFMIDGNEISGTIPTSILNCSLLTTLEVSYNKLHGELPPNIGLKLPNLVNLHIYSNQFSGTFPNSLLNLTSIESIILGANNFVGIVPHDFGRLQNLTWLILESNHFEGDINLIGNLVNCTKLGVLELSENNFTGILPESMSNLSTSIWTIELNHCGFRGNIPKHISNLVSLRELSLSNNELIGFIPPDLGKLQYLQHIDFGSNRLTDFIPESLGNISRLSELYLNNNRLEGSISPSLGDCQSLLFLDLSHNHLNGTLELFKGSTKFVMVDLYDNRLEGSIPQEIGNQINLVKLFMSRNKLSGIIPNGLGHCLSLQTLYISDNSLHGIIPTSFSSLGSLQLVDLSMNNLSGTIPTYFINFSQLERLNFSYNNFEGIVPTTGVFANISAISFDGNVKLCGGIPGLHLPRCKLPMETKKRRKIYHAVKLAVSIICALFGVLIIMAWLYLKCYGKKRVPAASGSTKEALVKVSYDMLLKATNGFSSENLVGVGSFGSVFRGTLNGNTVAVKVLNLQTRGASKSFMAECKALRNVRHRNLVGIITACSSIDYQRNEFKALVYEFMPNGSLDGWLHGNRVENITLLQRVDIAIDVAHALSYLHHDCEIPIIHCDLKPTNILLDDNMVARVGDFGLAKFLAHLRHSNQSSSIGVRGTVGYVAPEYGLGNEPCPKGDIYSYGILVLELMTGKRPTNHMFQEDYNLHSYTEAAFPDNVLQIVDPTLIVYDGEISEEEEEFDDIRAIQQAIAQRRVECIVSMTSVGIACSKHLPQDRMTISEAIRKLQAARDHLCNGRRNRKFIPRGTMTNDKSPSF
ncbi:hypothetical protein RND81_12G089600 [Saponaria officinalis]|uniref:non-specific serine/threonine protein kinase n=1 Tax=Saponaria officinalis TaxID=3572 RepID=A0AAW1H8A9_SAPOF